MNKHLILTTMLLTIFLDFFNLGLIYPIFSSIIFEGHGEIIFETPSIFQKNAIFGLLISAFPFGQFLGAPIIGQLSDHYGRRKLLILSLIGTVATLLICGLGLYCSNLSVLVVGRFIGGLMAGNMTLAYASLADFSAPEEKVKNFALIPLVTGMGFTCGPYLAGILGNPETFDWTGPTLPFLVAAFLGLVNLIAVFWKFPETHMSKNQGAAGFNWLSSLINLWKAFRERSLRPYLWILFFMISSNLVFVQFVGSFAIERFHVSVTEVGYLYANLGIAITLGHMFLTRRLANQILPETAMTWSLGVLALLLAGLLFTYDLVLLHVLSFCIMLACAVAYTNAMALVSNQAAREQQGEIMGVAVSIQSCAEFLPAVLLGLIASISQMIPLFGASLFALFSCLILSPLKKKQHTLT